MSDDTVPNSLKSGLLPATQKALSRSPPLAEQNADMSLEVPAFKGPHPTICVLADKTLPLHSFSQVQRVARLANPLLCISLPIRS